MARIHITIDIPPSGQAQVSITTEDNQRVVTPQQRRPGAEEGESPTAAIVKSTRESRGWSQAEFAKRIGCSPATISQLETGRKKLNERLLARIKNAGIILREDRGPSAARNGTH